MPQTGALLLTRIAAMTALGRVYATASAARSGCDFTRRALAALDVTTRADAGEIARIPVEGPLVVVANHPFGALDGLILLDLLRSVRPDVRLLGNRWLGALPELRAHLLLVDVFNGRSAVSRNALALRSALQWLGDGGCIGLFPAGEVAHARTPDGRVDDAPWRTTAAALVARTQAVTVPVFFEGANSRLFSTAGRVHPLLRTALLPHELLAKRGSTVAVRVGAPIEAHTSNRWGDAVERTARMRAAVDELARGARSEGEAASLAFVSQSTQASVAPRGPVDAITANVAELGEPLIESGAFQVFCARAPQMPHLLPELGRLREVAFRATGEGTGRERDTDAFDAHYRHLFVWDRRAREIAGAYRLGATDELPAGSGVAGLYTRTLFDYGPELLAQLGPALELGRSFVPPGYQRDFSPLLLLWKGISRVVSREPRYRTLFGVVSISDRYDSVSRQLMIKFLQTTRFDADLGRLVRARNPPTTARGGAVENATVERLEDVSALIRSIEPDGKDMPVLLRQYLKLNARLLGFTVDRSFGNVLDGLVVVHLDDVEPAILARYMGREEAVAFRNAGSATRNAAAASTPPAR